MNSNAISLVATAYSSEESSRTKS